MFTDSLAETLPTNDEFAKETVEMFSTKEELIPIIASLLDEIEELKKELGVW